MSKKPVLPGIDPVLGDLLERVRRLEAVTPGITGITEIDSTDGGIIVDNPTGPTTSLTAFKPQLCWATGSISAAGPGGSVGGPIPFAFSSFTNLLDYSTADQPKPLVDGWYQATATIRFDGLSDGDVASADLTNLAIGGGGPPDAFARTSAATADDTPPLNTAINLSLPAMPLTAADYYMVTVGVSTPTSNTITADVDLLVSILRPGTP